MAKIHPSTITNVAHSRTSANLVLFGVVLDEIDLGDEAVGDIGVGTEGVVGVEIGVEVGKRLPWFVGWWVALTLPFALVFVVRVCHKTLVEDRGAP